MAEVWHVNTMKSISIYSFIYLILCNFTGAWIHNLKLQDDDRPRITMTRSFGFLKGGTMAVNISIFSFNGTDTKNIDDKSFGFSLERSKSSGFGSYMDGISTCAFSESSHDESSSVFFKFDLKTKQLRVELGAKDLQNLTVVATPLRQYLLENHLAHGEEEQAETSQGAQDKSKPSEDKSKPDAKAENEAKSDASDDKPKSDASDDKSKSDASDDKSKSDASDDKSKSVASVDKPKGDASKDKSKTETPDDEATKTKASAAAGKKKDGNTTVRKEPKSPNERRRRDTASKDVKTPSGKNATETQKDKAASSADVQKVNKKPQVFYLPMTSKTEGTSVVYGTYFLIHIKTEQEEGLYNLFFHNCQYRKYRVNLAVQIIQDNNGNYLSADEMPIPSMYFLFSVVFFVLTLVWFVVLRKAKEGVYKIHYLMLVVVIFRCLSDLFHGVNMHMIQLSGIHVDAWAILWYIVYLMRGAVMFVTVLLIGAGWAFIKHVFTDREKKLFLIVIPLQILMNVAWVIMEESEEGYSSYNTWHTIFIGVDLLCCFAILFPVIWSIRHLQEASKTDGKAAINLNKLKLFRHFYVLVVAYIYFTRIIGILLQITLPFRYGWMKDLFEEIFLLVFFTLTGYKFRPTSDNPYLQVPQDSDDEDIEMDEVVTKSGSTDSVVRVNQGKGDKSASTKQRESSHEYD